MSGMVRVALLWTMASTKSMVETWRVFFERRSALIRCANLHLVSLPSSDRSNATANRARATAGSVSGGE
eukprot:3371478-Rhodomonas_salina.1